MVANEFEVTDLYKLDFMTVGMSLTMLDRKARHLVTFSRVYKP